MAVEWGGKVWQILGKSRHRVDQLSDLYFRVPRLAVWLHHSYNVLSCEATNPFSINPSTSLSQEKRS
jgi:hypothetical protein